MSDAGHKISTLIHVCMQHTHTHTQLFELHYSIMYCSKLALTMLKQKLLSKMRGEVIFPRMTSGRGEGTIRMNIHKRLLGFAFFSYVTYIKFKN